MGYKRGGWVVKQSPPPINKGTEKVLAIILKGGGGTHKIEVVLKKDTQPC